MTTIEEEFKIQPGEKVLATIRKHWFILLQNTAGIVIVGIIPPLLTALFMGRVGGLPPATILLFIFLGCIWLLVVWMVLAVAWTNYYLDMWVITENRVIYIEQIRLFVREVRTLPHERMQDVSVRYSNIIETLLDFGTLRVQSAGAIQNDILMHGMPHPHDVRNLMLTQAECLKNNNHSLS